MTNEGRKSGHNSDEATDSDIWSSSQATYPVSSANTHKHIKIRWTNHWPHQKNKRSRTMLYAGQLNVRNDVFKYCCLFYVSLSKKFLYQLYILLSLFIPTFHCIFPSIFNVFVSLCPLHVHSALGLFRAAYNFEVSLALLCSLCWVLTTRSGASCVIVFSL